ncbi:MAG: DUF2523 domain-containing protein [Betaproteobacteria bacterium]|nr:DUF2523 domain-containing protein [Betaproteobacteria bacterium]
MDKIIATIVAFGEWLLQLVKDAFEAVWNMVVDAICYPVDKVLTFAVGLLQNIDVSGMQSAGSWSSLPAEMLNILGLIGFGQCMAVIGAAILIRLGLQLIPFVRLGS